MEPFDCARPRRLAESGSLLGRNYRVKTFGRAHHVLERDEGKYYFGCAGCKEKFAHAV
jgi:hypothetical protein